MRLPIPLCALLLLSPVLTSSVSAQAPSPAPAPLAASSVPPAASSPSPLPSLRELLGWLRSSPGWQAADLSYRSAELQVASARARAGLSLNVGGNVALAKVPWDSGEWATTTSLTANLGASVLPWSPAQEALRSAERARQVAATELRRTRADLTLQVLQAYAAAAQAASAATLAAAQGELARESLAVAQAQRESGMLPAEAVLERRAALEQALAGAEQTRRALALSSAQLSRLLGRPVSLPTDRAAYAPLNFTVSSTDPAALTARALAARPEVARAQAALIEAQATLATAQRNASLPDLTASAQFGQIGTTEATSGRRLSASLNVKGGTAGMQATFPLNDTSKLPTGAVLSLSGSLPLLGRTEGIATEQARVGVQQATLALDSARQSVALDVSSRLGAYLDELGAQTALQTALQRAQTVLDTTRARQAAGLSTALEVRQAELGLEQAQDNLRASRDRLALAALNLWQATADLDAFLLSSVPELPATPVPGGQP